MRRAAGVTVDDVIATTSDFERSYVAVVHGRIKLRVGRIVYVAFSRDETIMGFGRRTTHPDAGRDWRPDTTVENGPNGSADGHARRYGDEHHMNFPGPSPGQGGQPR
jgi:hypothetical protein